MWSSNGLIIFKPLHHQIELCNACETYFSHVPDGLPQVRLLVCLVLPIKVALLNYLRLFIVKQAIK
jgi:hypothetical protein